jgi:ribosomal protein S12 methylthiotransferase
MHYVYPYPHVDDVIPLMAQRKVLPYLDIPFQHGSPSVLKRMKRPGTRASYEKLLDRIRARVPGVTLRTTVIVGYPGETTDDFAELQNFVTGVGFDHLGVFTYSHEEGTSAYQLDDDVPARSKAARRSRVMELQKRLVRKRQRGRIGERVRLLVDGPAGEHELVLKGRLATQAPDIDASVYLTECDPSQLSAGDFTDVEIVGARDYDLIARPVI